MRMNYDELVELLRDSNPLVDVRMDSEEYDYSTKILNLRYKLRLGEVQTANLCDVPFPTYVLIEKGDPKISIKDYKKTYNRLKIINAMVNREDRELKEIRQFKGSHQEVISNITNFFVAIGFLEGSITTITIENNLREVVLGQSVEGLPSGKIMIKINTSGLETDTGNIIIDNPSERYIEELLGINRDREIRRYTFTEDEGEYTIEVE